MYSISLSYNSFTDASADAFIDALQHNTTLEYLGLGGNNISYVQVASPSSLTVARGTVRRSRGVDDVSGAWAAPGGSASYRQPRKAIHGV